MYEHGTEPPNKSVNNDGCGRNRGVISGGKAGGGDKAAEDNSVNISSGSCCSAQVQM